MKSGIYISLDKEVFNVIVPYLYTYHICNLNSIYIELADAMRLFKSSGTSKKGTYTGHISYRLAEIMIRTCDTIPYSLQLDKNIRKSLAILSKYCKVEIEANKINN